MKVLFRVIYKTLFFITLLSCATDNTLYLKDAAVAVLDFDNLSPSASVQSDLGELLAAQVVETLQAEGDHPLVERDRLLLALEELQLGSASLADESTRLELGKISGAKLMVFGAYQIIGDQMRLDLRLVEVESGKIIKAVRKLSSASDISGWLMSAKEAAEELF